MAPVGLGHPARADEPIRLAVTADVEHPISPLLFGHFLEHANWGGELGVEAALLAQGDRLAPAVVERIERLEPPIIRFPGGGMVEKTDWTDFLADPPDDGWGRDDVQRRFGVDAFLALCERVNAEPLLVVNFETALLKRRPLHDVAQRAAALVAYCNAPLDAQLPQELRDWPGRRARRGRETPYRVRYFQIGNEIWLYNKETVERTGEAAYTDWHLTCLEAFVDAMRRVDPRVRLITDATRPSVARAIAERLGERIDMLSVHDYRPWGIREVKRDGQVVDAMALSPREVWSAWVATPQFDAAGQSHLPLGQGVLETPYRVAVTEWNWNGWWQMSGSKPPTDRWAQGVGAAGYLHALMRRGDRVRIANQSMMVGQSWGITAIRVDPEGVEPPHYLPTGAVLGFYTRHHGDRRLRVEFEGVPSYEQPYEMGGIRPAAKVAMLDVVATAEDRRVYLHLIHRGYDEAARVRVDGSAVSPQGQVTLRLLHGKPPDAEPPLVWQTLRRIEPEAGTIELVLPPRTVAVASWRVGAGVIGRADVSSDADGP